MKIDFGPKTQALLVALLVALASFLGSLFGANQSNDTQIGVKAIDRNGIICDSGETNCVESFGMNIMLRNAAGTAVHQLNSVTGWDKISVPSTIGTATPALVIDTAGNSNPLEIKKNSTVVASFDGAGNLNLNGSYVGITPVPTATAITLYMGAPASSYQQCGTQVVTDTATLTPVAGLTPSYVLTSLNSITADAARSSGLYSTGVITLTVKNTALTPAANTTPATVNYCIVGTK